MKLGTPGFIGSRLREGREARGLTATSLADLLGVTRSAVSQYELDIQSPRPEVLERASKVLNLPVAYFLRKYARDPFPVVFCRSMSADTKASRLRAECRLEWLKNITTYLKCYVETPSHNIPKLELATDPQKIGRQDIEHAAMETRKRWGIGDAPIANLVRTIENNGIVIALDELGSESLKAVSAWHGPDGYVLLDSNLVAATSRYELARQVGHLILHANIAKQQLATNNDFSLIKRQASRFAAALLLPESSFCADLYALSLEAMRIVKQKWKAPIGIMIKRLEDLELINEEQAHRLWMGKSRRHWKESAEPLDDELPRENPKLLSECVTLLVEEQIVSKAEILYALPYSDRDLELLSGLPQGYITDTMPVVTILAPKQRRLELSNGETAPVLNFPSSHKTSERKQRRAERG